MTTDATPFLDRLIGARGHMVHRIRATDSDGKPAIYFVYVRPDREAAFLSAIAGDGNMDLADFGEIVGSCYGDEPTAELKEYLNNRYGFDV